MLIEGGIIRLWDLAAEEKEMKEGVLNAFRSLLFEEGA